MEFLTPKCLWVADSQKAQHRLFGLCGSAIPLLGICLRELKPFGQKKKKKNKTVNLEINKILAW